MKQPLLNTEGQYSIFRLPEALTCWPALGVMAASFLAAALVFALGGFMARLGWVFPLVLSIVAFVIAMAGTSAAGICLTDLARQRPYRSHTSYLLAGLACLPKLLGAGLLMALAALAVLLCLAVVLVLCKIPVLGPVLLVAVVPVSVLVVAAALVAWYVATSIAGPAIWDGERVLHSLSIAWHITRKYPFAAIGKIVGGVLLCVVFASMLMGVVSFASFTVAGVGASVIGMGMQFNPGMLSGYGVSGHMVGAGVGFTLVFALATAFVLLLPLMVGVLTWCEFSAKIDLGHIREAADEKLKDVNAKVQEMKEKAQTQATAVRDDLSSHAQRPADAAPVAASSTPAMAAASAAAAEQNATETAKPCESIASAMPAAVATAPAATSCPQCHGAVEPTDRFCDHCGHKLF
ncbi:MAG: zinc ribbon domain-containing protein [Acidovorax sp.]|uniref:zinc ribbon domain-containing protein n=1 Tax=Acidovorax sp. TaxID=1872122 RepID=UPI003919EB6C